MLGMSNVLFFFILGTLAFAFLAFRFVSGNGYGFRMFGIGLGLLAVAFAVWSVIVGTKPADLTLLTTMGVIPFATANVFFVAAGTSDFGAKARTTLITIATVVIAALFVIRTFINPSKPSLSENGLFYFNADPLAILLYVIVFAGALMPAVHIVSYHVENARTAIFTRLFFNVVTLAAVVLLVSKDDELQVLNGYVLLAGLIGLVVTHARKRPAFIAR